MSQLTQLLRIRINELCPGEAYHSKSQGEAELVANEMMDHLTRLCVVIDALDVVEDGQAANSDLLRSMVVVMEKDHRHRTGHRFGIGTNDRGDMCDQCLALGHLREVLFPNG